MNNMLLALEITALGMGLVFAAIILLWWMMSFLTSITTEKEPAPQQNPTGSDSIKSASVTEDHFKAQAAAIAVATALAEQQVTSAHPLPEAPTVIVSAWQLGMRTRLMYQKGVSIRRRISQDHK
jgi:Na+-transporting methylmalonyl-CoA/oxaloacetate decarboxylase gamma subunit